MTYVLGSTVACTGDIKHVGDASPSGMASGADDTAVGPLDASESATDDGSSGLPTITGATSSEGDSTSVTESSGADISDDVGSGEDSDASTDDTEVGETTEGSDTGLTRLLAAADYRICALTGDGRARCWGTNRWGIAGYPPSTVEDFIGDDETPESTGDLAHAPEIVGISNGGEFHSCVVLTGGRLRCWGYNPNGQLGYGDGREFHDPNESTDLELGGRVRSVVAGRDHTCVLLEAGTVRCWGSGDHGQLGLGSTEQIGDDEVPTTVDVVDLGGSALQLAAGAEHTCALLEGGLVRCWGAGGRGVLGQGHTQDIGDDERPGNIPAIELGAAAVQVSTGHAHSCARLTDGRVRCWGFGGGGRLGYGHTQDIGDDERPGDLAAIELGGRAIDIASGSEHNCAVLASGEVRCWGDGEEGRLGHGNLEDIGDDETPAAAGPVDVGGSVTQIIAATRASCALLATGHVRCWGHGSYTGSGSNWSIGDDEVPSVASPLIIW